MRWHLRVGFVLLIGSAVAGIPAPVSAGAGVVLGIQPGGAVVDVEEMPEARPGARVGFVRDDAERKETGKGWILDIKDGRALVGLAPGSTVGEGDLVTLCAPPAAAGPSEDLRAMLGTLREQASRAPAPRKSELQTVARELQAALDARDAALRKGACDTSEYDRKIAALAEPLQRLSGGREPPASETDEEEAPAERQRAGGPGPAPSPDPAPPRQTADATIETLSRAVDVIARLAEVAQSFRGTPRRAKGGAESAPAGSGPAPTGPQSESDADDAGTRSDGTQPSPPQKDGSMKIARRLRPVPGDRPGSTALAPGPASTGPAGVPWWQTPKPAKPGASASPAGGSAPTGMPAKLDGPKPASQVVAPKFAPGQPDGPKPGAQVVAPKPAPGQLLATLTGRVLNDRREPVTGARVEIGGIGTFVTDAQGRFTAKALKPGRYQVSAAGSGLRAEARTVDLEKGEIESVDFALQRALPAAKTFTPAPGLAPRR